MSSFYLFPVALFFLISCGSPVKGDDVKDKKEIKEKKYTRFNGNYNKTFNDLQDVHLPAAEKNGIGPLDKRADTTIFMSQLVRIPNELDIYKVDRLKHSMPYLVPSASKLLSDICFNFRDSLASKKMPIYKPFITSILRTNEDVKRLSKGNRNASENSVHRYGTTFDISWIRFEKVNPKDERTLDDGRLKAILGQVLHDLRERDRCYVKHERKQSCFHITVR